MNYKKIYNQIFDIEIYNSSPSISYNISLDFILSKKIKSLIDIGSGRGNMIKKIFDYGYYTNITSCDLEKYHNYDVKFISLDLTKIEDLNKIPKSESGNSKLSSIFSFINNISVANAHTFPLMIKRC
jgi:hypothetical protein